MKLYGKYMGAAAGGARRRQDQEQQELPQEESRPGYQKQLAPRLRYGIPILLVMLASLSLTTRGQTFPFREYTSDDGLPQTQ